MNVTNHLLRLVVENRVADGVNQVCLAETGATIDEQRVIGATGVVATCMAAARARSLALPTTRLSR